MVAMWIILVVALCVVGGIFTYNQHADMERLHSQIVGFTDDNETAQEQTQRLLLNNAAILGRLEVRLVVLEKQLMDTLVRLDDLERRTFALETMIAELNLQSAR